MFAVRFGPTVLGAVLHAPAPLPKKKKKPIQSVCWVSVLWVMGNHVTSCNKTETTQGNVIAQI